MTENVQPFARTLEQELNALLRGASLECLACGEFVMHARKGIVFCPECRTIVESDPAGSSAGDVRREVDGLEFGVQAG